jgi:hypothetical protein
MSFNFGELLDEDFSNVINRLKGEVDDGGQKINDSNESSDDFISYEYDHMDRALSAVVNDPGTKPWGDRIAEKIRKKFPTITSTSGVTSKDWVRFL